MRVKIYAQFETDNQTTQTIEIVTLNRQQLTKDVALGLTLQEEKDIVHEYYYGDIISTAFVESTVNEVISKRMVKKQQMRWTKQDAHSLLQLRIKNLNNELREQFCKWYPEINDSGGYSGVVMAA